jgi:NAD(P)-dependent dehydrogenase (short-subunit alcohol dehydrogenase family)
VERFAGVDIWINNAGLSGPVSPAWQQAPDEARRVVQTNLLGSMYGAIAAAQGMVKQSYGAIYNMEGMGSDGRKHNGLAYYGTTKYALHYFTECLAAETHATPLVIGALRPGMVATEMLSAQYKDRPEEWQRAKKVFNLLAEKPEPVAEWLAERILENQRSGVVLKYMTSGRLVGRMLRGLVIKRDLFA